MATKARLEFHTHPPVAAFRCGCMGNRWAWFVMVDRPITENQPELMQVTVGRGQSSNPDTAMAAAMAAALEAGYDAAGEWSAPIDEPNARECALAPIEVD